MVRIAISEEAYEAIARTLALGSVAAEPQLNENGEHLIWLQERWLDKLNCTRCSGEAGRAVGRTLDTQTALSKLSAMRRRGESYSDVIVRLAATEGISRS
jgi:hypothetical protein